MTYMYLVCFSMIMNYRWYKVHCNVLLLFLNNLNSPWQSFIFYLFSNERNHLKSFSQISNHFYSCLKICQTYVNTYKGKSMHAVIVGIVLIWSIAHAHTGKDTLAYASFTYLNVTLPRDILNPGVWMISQKWFHFIFL